MELSVIIVTFNSALVIDACLRSIFEQLKGLKHELIVVDNASADATDRLIERGFPEVILVRNESNVGFAKANNLGLSKAKGEFILLINPDTVWKRGEMKEAIRWMKKHPEIGALGCRLVLEDGSRQKSHGSFPTLMREWKESLYLPRIFPRWQWMRGVYAYEDSFDPKPVDWISCTFFVSYGSLMAEIGFFDERYFMYYEDIDLSKRIREKGREIYYYPEIEVTHRQKEPSLIDSGESPYLYYHKFYGLSFAKRLKYILILKTFLRLLLFLPFAFFSGKKIFRDKVRSNYRTLKFSLFEASEVLRGLEIGAGEKTDKDSTP